MFGINRSRDPCRDDPDPFSSLLLAALASQLEDEPRLGRAHRPPNPSNFPGRTVNLPTTGLQDEPTRVSLIRDPFQQLLHELTQGLSNSGVSDAESVKKVGRREDRKKSSTREKDNARDTEALLVLNDLPNFDQSCLKSCEIIVSYHEEYKHILKYFQNSQAHPDFTMDLIQIIRVCRKDDNRQAFILDPRQKMMLWHGTKKTRVGAILKEGFRKPVRSGQMFGSGIYFADRVSKSALYCGVGNPKPEHNSVGYLLLCDVIVGNQYKAETAHHEFTNAPKAFFTSYDSVKGEGTCIPDIRKQERFDGSIWPSGKTVRCENNFNSRSNLKYNEYIVYEPKNVRIKYLLTVRFNDARRANEECKVS